MYLVIPDSTSSKEKSIKTVIRRYWRDFKTETFLTCECLPSVVHLSSVCGFPPLITLGTYQSHRVSTEMSESNCYAVTHRGWLQNI